MKRTVLFTAFLFLLSVPGCPAQHYGAKGLILKVDKPKKTLVVSCEEIPGFMEAMAMPFEVRDSKELDGLAAGTMIQFTLVVDGSTSYIESIRIHRYEGVEQDPIGARRLKLMASLEEGNSGPPSLKVGEGVPDFLLIDQSKQTIALSQFTGKVVAITFTYTHCALPNFCFRISNCFRSLQKRFANEMGHDLILLTITFDPTHDTPEVMAKYGKT
jgi:protein SCO1